MMAGRSTELFDESVMLDHAQSPYHRGRAPSGSCAHAERNAACGDWVRLEQSVVSGQWSVVGGGESGFNRRMTTDNQSCSRRWFIRSVRRPVRIVVSRGSSEHAALWTGSEAGAA